MAVAGLAVGGLAVGAVVADDLGAAVHEDAVVVLHARAVAVLQGVAAGGQGLADGGHVVERARGHGLGVALRGAVDLELRVEEAGARGGDAGVAGDDQAELAAAAPAVVEVDRVVADVPDLEVLEVDGAAPDLDAVVDVVHHLDVVDLGLAADAAERDAVELVAEADHLAAVAEGAVLQDAAVVEVVAAAVERTAVGRARLGEALHDGHVVRARGGGVAGDRAGAVLADVAAAADREVAPLVAGRAPRAGLRIPVGPRLDVGLGGEDDRLVGGAEGHDAGVAGDRERAAEVRGAGDHGAGLDGEGGAGQDVDLALQVVGVVLRPGRRRRDVGGDQDLCRAGGAGDGGGRDGGGDGGAEGDVLHVLDFPGGKDSRPKRAAESNADPPLSTCPYSIGGSFRSGFGREKGGFDFHEQIVQRLAFEARSTCSR